VSKPGYDIAIVSVAPEAGQVLDLDAPLALVEAQPAALPLAGTVKVAGLTDHAGTLVNVDDGAAITTTGTNGSFTVNVNAGRHVLRATRSGFASVVLGTISVAADGGVAGLVPVFLTAGADAVEGEADGQGAAPGLEVRAPLPGTIVPSGVPVVLAADLDNVDGDAITLADVSWHSRPVGETEFSLLGTGGLFSARFSVLTSTDIEIEARVDGVGLVASTLITVTPLLRTGVRAGVSAVQVIVPPLVDTDDDGDFDLDVGQGIPVDVVVSIDGADTNVVWEGPGGLSFTDRLPLGALPTGNHRFTAIIEAPAGLIEGAVVEISVHNVDFTVDVVEPAVSVTSSTTAPLPLRVSISHEFQRAFDSSNVRWSLLDGTFIASGPAASSLNAPTGSQTLLVEVTDVAGHRLQSTRDYVRNPVSFAAAFTAPAPGIVPTVELGDPVAVAVSFAHSEGVAAGDIRVRLTSSISGSLLVNGDEPDFAPNETVNVTLPTTGSHVLTARLTTGVQTAFATATVNVIAPFVSARLTSPTTTSITLLETPPEVGPDVVFSLADNATPGHEADVRRTWFLDGIEFDAAWGGYGTNVTSETRRSLNMGPYSISSGTFDDPRFAPGPHEVTVWVRLPEVETAGINRCVDTGSASRCLRFNLTTTNTPIVQGSETVAVGQTKVLSGEVLLTGTVTVFGTVIVTPGTSIIANGNLVGFSLANGSLRVGEDDAALVTMAMRAGLNTTWTPFNGNGAIALRRVEVRDASGASFGSIGPPVFHDVAWHRGTLSVSCAGAAIDLDGLRLEGESGWNMSSCPNSHIRNVAIASVGSGPPSANMGETNGRPDMKF